MSQLARSSLSDRMRSKEIAIWSLEGCRRSQKRNLQFWECLHCLIWWSRCLARLPSYFFFFLPLRFLLLLPTHMHLSFRQLPFQMVEGSFSNFASWHNRLWNPIANHIMWVFFLLPPSHFHDEFDSKNRSSGDKQMGHWTNMHHHLIHTVRSYTVNSFLVLGFLLTASKGSLGGPKLLWHLILQR